MISKSPAKNHFLKILFSILFSCLFAFSLVSCGGDGQTPSIINWAKTYGGVDEDVARSISQTSDGGYIVAGETYSNGAVLADFWVIKLKTNGDIDWQKTFGGTSADVAYSIQQTLPDGGYVIAGQSSSFGNQLGDIWILKINSTGEINWQKTYGGGSSAAKCIKQTSDGGYIVAGETLVAGSTDVWVLKLNANGVIVWQKTYGGAFRAAANSIQQTTDGGFIVAGEASPSGVNIPDFYILKLYADGTVQWEKTFGGSGYDIARAIQQTSDGGYIVAGETPSGASNADFWILKLNSSGDLVWQKTYGGAFRDAANSIQQTSDGGYIVAGETYSSGAGSADFWVLKIDGNGNVN